MNCLVLGGAGFIGSHVVDTLLAAGHRVRVFEHPDCNPANLAGVRERIELCRGDFTRPAELEPALDGIDQIVHLVGTVLPASSNLKPCFDIETNLKSTVALLEMAVKNRVEKVVFASSGGTVYGIPEALPLTEKSPTEPLTSYGIVKLATEKYLQLFHHLHGLDYTVLRIANPYGERQNPAGAQGAVAVFLGRIREGRPIEIWGDGDIARDYLYIGDLARAFLKACETSRPEKLFNIGSGRPCSLNRLLELLGEVTGRPVAVDYQPARACDVPVNYLDCGRAARVLDWEPRVSLRDGLERTWQWLRQR